MRQVLRSWGPGKFDAELILDGKAFRPDGKSAATLIPPAFGLAGVNLHTWTGWGSVPHWNAFVAEPGDARQGHVLRPAAERRQCSSRSPRAPGLRQRAQRARTSSRRKLAALHLYQLAIPAPTPPEGSFDDDGGGARRGALRRQGALRDLPRAAALHRARLEHAHAGRDRDRRLPGRPRSPDRRYRTAPLKGLWTHTKGGFYHDGRFATLRAVVNHYNGVLNLGLTDGEQSDLVEYLKSL